MTGESIMHELDRLNAELDDPTSDNTAGRLYSLRYDSLPQLLCSNRHLIAVALRAFVKPSHFQSELTLMPTRHEKAEHTAALDGNFHGEGQASPWTT